MASGAFGYGYTCGWNGNGQLGNGTTTNETTFGPMFDAIGGSQSGVVGMAAGGYHTLLLEIPVIRVTSVTVSPTSVKGGANATGTVTLNGVAGPGGQRVYLYFYSVDQSGNYVNAANMPAYVDVPAASKTATFPITTTKVSSKTTTTVDAYLNLNLATTLTIQP